MISPPAGFLAPPVVYRGRRYRTVAEACRANPSEAKTVRRCYAAVLAGVIARMTPPPEPHPGDLPDPVIPGIEPPPKPKSKAEARRLRVAAAKARAKPAEPDPVLAGLAAALDLPPMQVDF